MGTGYQQWYLCRSYRSVQVFTLFQEFHRLRDQSWWLGRCFRPRLDQLADGHLVRCSFDSGAVLSARDFVPADPLAQNDASKTDRSCETGYDRNSAEANHQSIFHQPGAHTGSATSEAMGYLGSFWPHIQISSGGPASGPILLHMVLVGSLHRHTHSHGIFAAKSLGPGSNVRRPSSRNMVCRDILLWQAGRLACSEAEQSKWWNFSSGDETLAGVSGSSAQFW